MLGVFSPTFFLYIMRVVLKTHANAVFTLTLFFHKSALLKVFSGSCSYSANKSVVTDRVDFKWQSQNFVLLEEIQEILFSGPDNFCNEHVYYIKRKLEDFMKYTETVGSIYDCSNAWKETPHHGPTYWFYLESIKMIAHCKTFWNLLQMRQNWLGVIAYFTVLYKEYFIFLDLKW
jgi:hypothetical protein